MTDALKLFLVEDDDNIALLISSWLERAGHEVTRCRTAADALIVLAHNSYDLVLLDHRLPDMAGLDLLDAFSREGINTPALMVTAYGDEQIATRALQAGALVTPGDEKKASKYLSAVPPELGLRVPPRRSTPPA